MTDFATTIAQHNGHHPATVEQDEFNSEAFEGGRETLPYLQMLNHQNPDQSGFFITSENAETAGFALNEEWSLHLERFQSGEMAEDYRSLYQFSIKCIE